MHPRVILSAGNFFFSMCAALTAYILLPFLTEFMPETYTGLVVAGGGGIAVLFFFYLPRLVARFGARQLVLVAATIELLSLLALAVVPSALTGIVLIAVTLALQPFVSYALDVLLEATAIEHGEAGRVRSLFLTAWNVGVIAAPLLLGLILVDSNDYSHVFIAAAAMLLPCIVLFMASNLPEKVSHNPSHMKDTLVCMSRDRDLSAVTFAHFLLYLFYSLMFYIPLYLHAELGIPWSTLGWMFSIMLLPYVLIEYPAGWIADRLIGDKGLMVAGFLIAGSAIALLSTLSPMSSLLLVLVILVVSRVGFALIESMTEGHFFRRVTDQDVNSISFFRGVWPLANIVGPVIASLLLLVGDYHLLFVLTGGCLALVGTATALSIRDFR